METDVRTGSSASSIRLYEGVHVAHNQAGAAKGGEKRNDDMLASMQKGREFTKVR